MTVNVYLVSVAVDHPMVLGGHLVAEMMTKHKY